MGSGWSLNLAKGVIKPTNIATKFYDDPLNNICSMRSNWLLNVVERLCQQALSLSLIHQVWWWSLEKNRADMVYFGNFGLFKGHSSKVILGIWLVVKLARDILPTNNVTKFDDDPLKNIQVTERTLFICTVLHFSIMSNVSRNFFDLLRFPRTDVPRFVIYCYCPLCQYTKKTCRVCCRFFHLCHYNHLVWLS